MLTEARYIIGEKVKYGINSGAINRIWVDAEIIATRKRVKIRYAIPGKLPANYVERWVDRSNIAGICISKEKDTMKLLTPIEDKDGRTSSRVCDECLEPTNQVVALDVVVLTGPQDEYDRPVYCLTCLRTTDERAELNAWIAEHVFHAAWYDNYPLQGHEALRWTVDGSVLAVRNTETKKVTSIHGLNYDLDWTAAGPLFDRYPGMILRKAVDPEFGYEIYFKPADVDTGIEIAAGSTGPEAIAKAVRTYHEMGEKT